MTEILCRLADLEDPGGVGTSVERDGETVRVMVIRQGDEAFGWVNSCPHARVPLESEEGRFLDLFRTHILCSFHGSQFDIRTGACLWGPCRGRGLTPFPVRVVDGMVVAD